MTPQCDCEMCRSGAPVPLEQWLETPKHKLIHEAVKAALAAGTIEVKGE